MQTILSRTLFFSLPDIRRQQTKHAYTYPRRKLHFLPIGPHLSLLSSRIFSQQILSIRTPCYTSVDIGFHRHFHRRHSLVCRLQVRTVQNIEELKWNVIRWAKRQEALGWEVIKQQRVIPNWLCSYWRIEYATKAVSSKNDNTSDRTISYNKNDPFFPLAFNWSFPKNQIFFCHHTLLLKFYYTF